MAERYVQTMKAPLLKTLESQSTITTKLLNSRKYKNLLPTWIVPTRLQESYRQIMNKDKQRQAQLYNKNTRVLPRLEQSQKVMVQLDPDKNIITPAEIIQCPVQDSRSYSLKTIHSGVYTRNRRFIKPDQTEPVTPTPQPNTEQRVTRPTRVIKKPDRLIESK